MPISSILAFWGVSLLFVLTPGADWAYAIAAGLRDRSVLPAVGGLLAGHLVATVVVAAGVASLVSRTPTALTVLTALGAGYLLWLGVAMLRASVPVPAMTPAPAAPPARTAVYPHTPDTPDTWDTSNTSWAHRVIKGAGVSGLNPKVFLLFLALMPQFTTPEGAWPVAAQIGALGTAHLLSCAVVYTVVAVTARRVLRARPTAARLVTRVSGTAMIVIAAVLLVEQLAHALQG